MTESDETNAVMSATDALSLPLRSVSFLPPSLLLLTFRHNSAASLMAEVLPNCFFFSQIPNRVNVKMEDFTRGWCPVLTEDLLAAVSDMEWSVNGWRAVSIKRYACEVQRQGWDKMQDNLRALKSRLINVWFIAVCVSTCVCHCPFLLVSRMNEQRHCAPF